MLHGVSEYWDKMCVQYSKTLVFQERQCTGCSGVYSSAQAVVVCQVRQCTGCSGVSCEAVHRL